MKCWISKNPYVHSCASYVYAKVCSGIGTFMHRYGHAQGHSYTYMYVHAKVCTFMHKYVCACTGTFMHSCVVCSCTCTFMHTVGMLMHKYVHTEVHSCTGMLMHNGHVSSCTCMFMLGRFIHRYVNAQLSLCICTFMYMYIPVLINALLSSLPFQNWKFAECEVFSLSIWNFQNIKLG